MTTPTPITWTGLTAFIWSTKDLTADFVDAQGNPYQLTLDTEHREALGCVLIDPPGVMDDDDLDETPTALGRTDRDCDGTNRDGTRNCPQHAVWQLREPGEGGEPFQACAQHLSQVGTNLLGGEQGDLEIRRIRTVER
ncbi:hypothetical protein [Streptomyces sp. NPDC047981]|uniref:hypothetical protein n=1 Tax=Streptomyces sp. NPDC047981 TaxID=3154610 RepID=UPI0034120086